MYYFDTKPLMSIFFTDYKGFYWDENGIILHENQFLTITLSYLGFGFEDQSILHISNTLFNYLPILRNIFINLKWSTCLSSQQLAGDFEE